MSAAGRLSTESATMAKCKKTPSKSTQATAQKTVDRLKPKSDAEKLLLKASLRRGFAGLGAQSVVKDEMPTEILELKGYPFSETQAACFYEVLSAADAAHEKWLTSTGEGNVRYCVELAAAHMVLALQHAMGAALHSRVPPDAYMEFVIDLVLQRAREVLSTSDA